MGLSLRTLSARSPVGDRNIVTKVRKTNTFPIIHASTACPSNWSVNKIETVNAESRKKP